MYKRQPHNPWFHPTQKIEFTNIQTCKYNSDISNADKQKWAKDRVKRHQRYYIYTDGSAKDGSSEGGAGVAIYDESFSQIDSINTIAGSLCSSFDTECVALISALAWINDSGAASSDIQILTDSMSLVTALQSDTSTSKSVHVRSIRELLGKSQNQITLTWIPAHCGFDGNWVATRIIQMT